jgi:cellulose synthase/poly-beta-1,6-N-acetylglucosamine synthase-like glycosyltransferase
MRRVLAALLWAPAAYLVAVAAYLVALLGAAHRWRPRTASPARPWRFVVLVPAHDEAAIVADAVTALLAQEGAWEAEVVVIADNCTDRTAEVAERAGATAWVRDAPDARGKGQALAWALERLGRERPGVEAIAVVDADCVAQPGLLAAFARAFATGARAAQADYVVSNAAESPVAARRAAGFLLMHGVRPRGKDVLGRSCGLFGTGMAFTTELLADVPWTAFGVTEGIEFQLELLARGERIAYAGEAAVLSPMPVTAEQAAAQQTRWETGNVQAARRRVPGLLAQGLRRRDPELVHAAWERLVPAQGLVLVGGAAVAAASLAAGLRGPAAAAGAALAGQVGFVVGGLRLMEADEAVWRALRGALPHAGRRALLVARVGVRGGATTWERTARSPVAPDG